MMPLKGCCAFKVNDRCVCVCFNSVVITTVKCEALIGQLHTVLKQEEGRKCCRMDAFVLPFLNDNLCTAGVFAVFYSNTFRT